MAAINDLIRQIEDNDLRDRLQQEVVRLSKQKKFGLVFEDHVPECTPLYDVAVRKGSLVAVKGEDIRDVYFVSAISDKTAAIVNKATGEMSEHPLETLVAVAKFGEPIFPFLIPVDSIANAPDSRLWHTLIEADNFHALQLLEYLYPKQVDCIYIDPPYNTGARDWKYNNDYVDATDSYRHSKWLSMMHRRLKIAKRLSQSKFADVIGSTQSSINRYENGQATPTVELLRKYADYFDVSMDYIFARCDNPHGKLYEAKPPVDANNPELRKFVEMCFDPESPMNEKLKEAMLKMLGEAKI